MLLLHAIRRYAGLGINIDPSGDHRLSRVSDRCGKLQSKDR